ncbi:MAG: low temperature requirement protein A, partial [Actinomycetota bacterium]
RVRTSLPETRPLVDLYLRSFAGSLVLWAGSLLVPTPARYWIWALALGLEFLAPIAATRRPTTGLPADNEHFQERYALLTIIVLGETFVKTISEVTGTGLTVQTQVFGGLASIMLIAIWWTYFDDVAESHIRHQSALFRGAATNRLAWAYTHLPLTAGMTAFGVASKKMVGVEAFDDAFKDTYTWLLVGALIVVLVSVALLDVVTVSPHYAVDSLVRVGPRLVAGGVLVPLGLLTASGRFSALVGLGAIGLVVVVQIGVEILVAVRSDRRLNEQIRVDLIEVEGSCRHLLEAPTPDPVDGALECRACHEKGEPWVYLRRCLTCGAIGCCDDSPGGHARTHFEQTGHAVITSVEIGDEWAYCFLDDTVDQTWLTDRRRRNAPST